MYTFSKDKIIPFKFSCNKAKHVQRDALKIFVTKICNRIEKQGGITNTYTKNKYV